jgi:hypothetical protein
LTSRKTGRDTAAHEPCEEEDDPDGPVRGHAGVLDDIRQARNGAVDSQDHARGVPIPPERLAAWIRARLEPVQHVLDSGPGSRHRDAALEDRLCEEPEQLDQRDPRVVLPVVRPARCVSVDACRKVADEASPLDIRPIRHVTVLRKHALPPIGAMRTG